MEYQQVEYQSNAVILCDICANWTLSLSTRERMKFTAPDDYPSTLRCLADCPVTIPSGREPGLEFLYYIDCDFPTLRQAGRYAFFNAMSGRAKGWTKKIHRHTLELVESTASNRIFFMLLLKRPTRRALSSIGMTLYSLGNTSFQLPGLVICRWATLLR
jgi:hypothetical protein